MFSTPCSLLVFLSRSLSLAHVWSRALLTSEAVASFRAGKRSARLKADDRFSWAVRSSRAPPALPLQLLLLLLHLSGASASQNPSNPLAGLPRLPKPHHSYGMCSKWSGFPTSQCGFPVDSHNPLQVDFARITQAWAVDIGDVYLEHNATTGVSIWNQTTVDNAQNKSEIEEVVRLCHKANASITINYSP